MKEAIDIDYFWNVEDLPEPLSPEIQEQLKRDAIGGLCTFLKEGIVEGELITVVTIGAENYEIYGWCLVRRNQ